MFAVFDKSFFKSFPDISSFLTSSRRLFLVRQFVRRVDELSGAMSGGLFRTDGGAMGGSSSGLDVSDIAEAWQRIRAGSAGEAWVLLETWLGSWAAVGF